jgi:hypothetical protein
MAPTTPRARCAACDPAEAPAERAREHFVTLESGVERNGQHRVVARDEARRRPLEPQPQRVLLGRLAHHCAKRTMEMKRRPASPCPECGQPGIDAIAHVVQEPKEVVVQSHRVGS